MFIRIIEVKAVLAALLFFVFVFALGMISDSINLASLADAFSQK